MSTSSNHHDNCTPLREFLSELRAEKDPLYVCKCQYTSDPKLSARYITFKTQDRSLHQLRTDWILTKEWPLFIEQLSHEPNWFLGNCDAMYGTGSQFVWVQHSERFLIFDSGRCLFEFSNGVVYLDNTQLPVTQVQEVHGFLSKDWVKRGIQLRLYSGSLIPVAETEEWVAKVDPTYDAIDITMDAAWVWALGNGIAKALSLPLILDKPLN